jgi:hypothetical protein
LSDRGRPGSLRLLTGFGGGAVTYLSLKYINTTKQKLRPIDPETQGGYLTRKVGSDFF